MLINRQWLVLIGSVLAGTTLSAQGALKSVHFTDVDAKPLVELEHAVDRGEYPQTTSILIMRNGRLAYERYSGEGNQELLNMLTMSCALACDDNDDASPGNEDNMHSQSNWTRWAVDLPTMQAFTRDAQGLGPWRYCTTNAFLLGQVIVRGS